MSLPLTIDGVDFSAYARKNHYTVTYETREGNNGGMMLDGTMLVDIRAYKAVITWELNALTSAQVATLMQAVLKSYVTVTFFDTNTNANRTGVFIPSLGTQNYAFERHGINYYKHGSVLTLRER